MKGDCSTCYLVKCFDELKKAHEEVRDIKRVKRKQKVKFIQGKQWQYNLIFPN